MKEPTVVDKAEIVIDPNLGTQGRTALILRFPTGVVTLDVSTYQAGRIRKLNRVAESKQEKTNEQ